jgi:transposase-like protein
VEKYCGSFEADESYFGGIRKGKRGRGAAGFKHRRVNHYKEFVSNKETC